MHNMNDQEDFEGCNDGKGQNGKENDESKWVKERCKNWPQDLKTTKLTTNSSQRAKRITKLFSTFSFLSHENSLSFFLLLLAIYWPWFIIFSLLDTQGFYFHSFYTSFSFFSSFTCLENPIGYPKGQEHNNKARKRKTKDIKEVKTRMKGTKWGAKESV